MYQHIMVPLDGSKLAECVMDHVVSIFKGCSVSKVSLVRVVTPMQVYGIEDDASIGLPEMQRLEQENMVLARRYLEEQALLLKEKGIDAQIEVIFGTVVDSLAEYAEKNNVDLIVIATHGRSGISRWVWGSVADRILRSAKVPVLMIRPPGAHSHGI